jgi:phosphoribosylformylglycinamidine synthase
VKVAVIQFPGSNCDLDAVKALTSLKVPTDLVWHVDFRGEGYDGAIIPGGFTYGDYLRAGAIAAHSRAIEEVKEMAAEGKPVGGICNGFQILIEAGLLPGALIENSSMKFVCRWVILKVLTDRTPFTRLNRRGQLVNMPVAHHQGNFFCADLDELYADDQVVFQYVDENGSPTEWANPNGSIDNIAGICNLDGNVVGLMPHPERASDALLSPTGRAEGIIFFESMIDYMEGYAHKG